MAKLSTNSLKDFLIHIGIVVALVASFFLAFFFIYLPFTTNHGESVTTPDISKMHIDDLEDYLSDRDLNFEITDYTYSDAVPPLCVISQNPKPGSQVKKGRKIYVNVRMEKDPNVKISKLTDMSLQSALDRLKDLGLKQGELRYVPDLAHGSVLKQFYNGSEITPGTEIPKGSKIDLEVGNGLGTTVFSAPSLIGMLEDEAEFQIIGAGLKVGQKIYVDAKEGQEPGTIVRQNPESGSRTRVGEVVDIWVVKPYNNLEIPE